MIIKNTSKKDILVKEAFVEMDKLIDAETGETLNIPEIVSKVYSPEQVVKITITASTTEEVDFSSFEQDAE